MLGSLVLVASAAATGPAPQQTAGKPICPPVKAGYARCHAWGRTNSAGRIAPNVTPSGYGPVQFQTAYGLTAAAAAPTNEIIAIVDAFDDPNAKSDLDTFNSTYGLAAFPTCSGSSNVGCFRKVNQNGGSTPPTVDGDWAVEISLDVQVAHSALSELRDPARRSGLQLRLRSLRGRRLCGRARQCRLEFLGGIRVLGADLGRRPLQPPGRGDHGLEWRRRRWCRVPVELPVRDLRGRHDTHAQRQQHASE